MSLKTHDSLGLLSPELQTKWDTIAQDQKKGISTTLRYVSASQTPASASYLHVFVDASHKAH